MKKFCLILICIISALFFSCSDELNTSDSLDDYKESEMAPVNQDDRAILLDKNDIVVATPNKDDNKVLITSYNKSTQEYDFLYRMKDYPYYILHAVYSKYSNKFNCECIIDNEYISSQSINPQIIHFDILRMTDSSNYMFSICSKYMVENGILKSSTVPRWSSYTPVAHYTTKKSSISIDGYIL